MKYSEARQGRVFVMRLEDGEVVHVEIERFAKEQAIRAAALIAVGGADGGSELVVGPDQGRTSPILPLEHILDNVHEIAGTGTIFPDGEGKPVLHMHMACGRGASPCFFSNILKGPPPDRVLPKETSIEPSFHLVHRSGSYSLMRDS